MIVLVTIHGIGFQSAPTALNADDGYADPLHKNLCAQPPLGDGVLGDDPNRLQAGGDGPVYVQSCVPLDKHDPQEEQKYSYEGGLGRLGTWSGSALDPSDQPLAPEGARLAHVALVYSNLEGVAGDLDATLALGVLGAPTLTHFATVGGIVKLAFQDIRVLAMRHGEPAPSLRVRPEAQHHRGAISTIIHHGAPATGPLATLYEIQDDVAAYVVRNELRERVRGFIRDAVGRLLARPDVEGVIINGHSNGTVMGFDLITAMSPPSALRVLAFITAGCPLRKYVDFMDWGVDGYSLALLRPGGWTNFYDQVDPVADPLQPLADWKRGDDLPPGGGPGMFVTFDPTSGAPSQIAVKDEIVDNVAAQVGGGLPAHNYWDNLVFCAKLAEVIAQVL